VTDTCRHQFAFPVQWIDTQDTLLDPRDSCQRLIEIGPGSTLVGLARQTLRGQIASGDRVGDVVDTLAVTSNEDEISYRYAQQLDLQDSGEAEPAEDRSAGTVVPTAPVVQVQAPAAQAVAAIQVDDTVVAGSEVLRALVARKLKIPINGVSGARSLKELCNGRSTLQNEMVGDFLNEFGALPDRPEDLSLSALGDAVTIQPAVPLGKTTTAAMQKLISTKMPQRFSMQDFNTYLREHWGLPPGRIAAIVLYALSAEPERRLSSMPSVHSYLDGLTNMYSAWAGLALSPCISQTAIENHVVASVTPGLSAEALKSSKRLARKQFDALSEFLDLDPHSQEHNKAENPLPYLQSQLDHWSAEFSEDFLVGIMPLHNPKKSRRFDAYWRSARQELLEYYQSIRECPLTPLKPSAFRSLLCSMRNKADTELVTLAKGVGQATRVGSRLAEVVLEQLLEVHGAICQHANTNIRPRAFPHLRCQRPEIHVTPVGEIQHLEIDRTDASGATREYVDVLFQPAVDQAGNTVNNGATIHIPGRNAPDVELDYTTRLREGFRQAVLRGMSFAGKHILVTGAGQKAIGTEVVRLFLRGGARVIVTTSREPSSIAKHFQEMYEREGAKGSELILLPFNQASARDCDALIDYIYREQGGLEWDLDAILPFAAVAEEGADLSDLGDKNELAHRLMMTNVLRLLGRIIKNKRARGYDDNPTQVILPLSPNHSIVGGDGMYAESKLGLESLLNRVRSESWDNELSVLGAVIGWTRSTSLTGGNDMAAGILEEHGVLTFSVEEMAFNLAMLMTPRVREACEQHSLLIDFGGGMARIQDCHIVIAKRRREIRSKAEIARAVTAERLLEKRDDKLTRELLDMAESAAQSTHMRPIALGIPPLPDYQTQIRPLRVSLADVPNPAEVVVVVGFSELGPFGSARVRWEWERHGKIGQAALVELAWFMGLITHVHEPQNGGKDYVGWIDAKTKDPVSDNEINSRYGDHIRAHIGIRFLEQDAAGTQDPTVREVLDEVSLREDLPSFEAPAAAAEALKRRHGEHVTVRALDDTRCEVQLKRGASIMVPKSTAFEWGGVAGQLPAGFDARRYGIPDDLARSLDPTAIFAVCCVAEAFYSAGLPEPLELFKHIHISELGNFIGSSIGGALKVRNLYKDVYQGRDIEGDALQDVYANTPAAWVNMLLLGSAGPIKTAVGACATGVESIDNGVESIMSGKTRVCLVGGVDDLQQDEAYGFSMLKATANAAEHLQAGRLPSEMSRPTAESRDGFVESLGGGVQILCRADLALELGLPIYGIIAGSAMASDGAGRSVPAPGRGILGFAREVKTAVVSTAEEEAQLQHLVGSGSDSSDLSDAGSGSNTPRSSSSSSASSTAASDRSTVLSLEDETPLTPPDRDRATSDSFFKSLQGIQHAFTPQPPPPTPSPLRAALATWGLSVDDIGMVSLHGTSTKANDINEPQVLSAQMEHLGRKPGNPMWAVCQKAITGHPKAPAATWMLNGCLQAMAAGIVPGNRNVDNIDAAWQHFEHLCIPTSPVNADIRAFTLTSFGFGQKGGQVIGVSPKYLLATQSGPEYLQYSQRFGARSQRAERAYMKAVMTNKIAHILDSSPYDKKDTNAVLLDPTARLGQNNTIETGRAPPTEYRLLSAHKDPRQQPQGTSRQAPRNVRGVGIDVVRLSTFDSCENEIFVERNFTLHERSAAAAHVSPRAALAGRWAAKEAVFKCLNTQSKGAGAAMKSIEIVTQKGGLPVVSVSLASIQGHTFPRIQEQLLTSAFCHSCLRKHARPVMKLGWPRSV
jgi:fatty acid synthase subunit alpha